MAQEGLNFKFNGSDGAVIFAHVVPGNLMAVFEPTDQRLSFELRILSRRGSALIVNASIAAHVGLNMSLRPDDTTMNHTLGLYVQVDSRPGGTAIDNVTGCTAGCSRAIDVIKGSIPLLIPLINKALANKPVVVVPSYHGVVTATLAFRNAYAEVWLANEGNATHTFAALSDAKGSAQHGEADDDVLAMTCPTIPGAHMDACI
jgi:hypothetical protein